MTAVQAIDIDLPVRTVYNQWTQLEDFSEFIERRARETDAWRETIPPGPDPAP